MTFAFLSLLDGTAVFFFNIIVVFITICDAQTRRQRRPAP